MLRAYETVFFTAHIYVFYTTHSYCLHGPFVVHFLLIPVRCNLRKGGFVVNMGGIELGSSDKHTQNHTYPRIARNPELRGIRGGSLRQLNPAHQNDSLLELRMGGKHALRSSDPAQTLLRPCSDMHRVQTQSSAARLPLFHQCLSSKTPQMWETWHPTGWFSGEEAYPLHMKNFNNARHAKYQYWLQLSHMPNINIG